MEQARAHRVKQDVHSERDRLLKHADKRVDVQSFLPSDGKDRARAILWTLALSLGPMLAYSAMLSMWFFVYRYSIVRFLCVLACLLCLSIFLVVCSFESTGGKERKWMWWYGVFTGQATLTGLIFGFFLYFNLLVYYWEYTEMRTYTNVAAAQDDKAFSDASMFLFTEDTRLDTQRAVGFKSRWTGEVYCISPIVDSTMSAVDPIYYWAIGEGCCQARADFHCGDSADTATRSALVVLEPSDIVRPFMTWAVSGGPYPRYEQAVTLQEATFVTKAAEDPKFVWWSRDPIALKDSFFNDAVSLCLQVSACYTLFLLVSMYIVAWKLVPKQHLEGVIRYAK